MRKSFVWKKVLFSQNNPNTPTPRKACSMNVWKNKVFVFGGETGFRFASNDLYTFSFREGWIKHNLENTPSPRSGHSSIIYEGSMYVFGGDHWRQDAEYHNFYSLNLETLSWKRIYTNHGTTDDLIKPKSFHSSILHEKRMIIYGGRTLMRPNVYFINHNVWSYNFETNSWEEMRCSGEQPAARFGHSASVIKNEVSISIHHISF
jgi:N-acetylneuraminic acid mutarotase